MLFTIQQFQTQPWYRSILNIHWSDFVTNIKVLEQAGVPSIEATLIKAQLCWAGHISRMEDHRLPKIVLYGELSTEHHNRKAPKKRFRLPQEICQHATSITNSGQPLLLTSEKLGSMQSTKTNCKSETEGITVMSQHNSGFDILLHPLCSSLSVEDWPLQPPASLHQIWTIP